MHNTGANTGIHHIQVCLIHALEFPMIFNFVLAGLRLVQVFYIKFAKFELNNLCTKGETTADNIENDLNGEREAFEISTGIASSFVFSS